ncbi:hypothetical protein SLE2022_314940 [Rubroshorea leprosula]
MDNTAQIQVKQLKVAEGDQSKRRNVETKVREADIGSHNGRRTPGRSPNSRLQRIRAQKKREFWVHREMRTKEVVETGQETPDEKEHVGSENSRSSPSFRDLTILHGKANSESSTFVKKFGTTDGLFF